MNVEIINVGTELLLGEIVNTNATYIQKMCKELGFNVYYQTTVGDNHDRFKQCLDVAFKRGASCVITTGGLGPTQDDLTKELSAEYLGLELIYDENEAKKVNDKCVFVTGNNEIPDNNFKQAFFPENCFVLENEVGTANGCVMSKDEKMIVNLPGPPKEMRYVVDNVLKDYLSKYKQDIIYTYDFLTMGIGESKVDEVLEDLIDHQKEVSIALYASEESVRVRLACKCASQEIADKKMKSLKEEIQKRLNDFILDTTNIKEAVRKILPPFKINYLDNFRLSANFDFNNFGDDLTVTIKTTSHSLGEIVNVVLVYNNKQVNFDIPVLKQASLSLTKIESKIYSQLYLLLNN